MTSGELLQHTAAKLKRHGIDDPQIEARILLSHAVELSSAQLLTHLDMCPEQSQIDKLEQCILRRIAREPVAYIIQRRDFYGLSFYVDHRVLIPRPETELLVEKALDIARNEHSKRTMKIADIGTGSGIIAISLAVHLTGSTIFAVDISPAALEVAFINCKRYGVEKQITLLHGDLLHPLPEPVDIIVANLPYIPEPEMSNLSAEIRQFEPVTALAGGPDGFRYIESLLQQALHKINAASYVLLEIGLGQRSTMTAIAERYFPGASVHFFKDLAGIDRVIQIKPKRA